MGVLPLPAMRTGILIPFLIAAGPVAGYSETTAIRAGRLIDPATGTAAANQI
jgi:hypothetical protein